MSNTNIIIARQSLEEQMGHGSAAALVAAHKKMIANRKKVLEGSVAITTVSTTITK